MIDVVMPQLGESVAEGTITKWLVAEGDVVAVGQAIVSVATDKADSEVPSPVAGTVTKLLVAEDETVRVGTPMAQIDETKTSGAGASAPKAAATAPAKEPPRAAPSVRQEARELGVDLGGVQGSGEHGRITRADVTAAAQPAPAAPPAPVVLASPVAPPASGPFTFPIAGAGFGSFKVPPYVARPGDKVVPWSRKRRITADHMVYSKFASPHVVTVAEVDLSRVMKIREAHKAAYKKEGLGLTVLAFVCQAITRALRQFPGVNARVDGGATVELRNVNLGVAVDAPDGLVVPNLKHADELSLRGMARAIGDLAARARDGKLTPDDFTGTSFSVTNPGLRGNLFGGAIISQPNVGILRMGEIKKRVVVVEEDGEDRIAIHPVMYAALSYDHRVIDGVLGNDFLWTIAETLKQGEFEP
ncbi:MAG: 2-oxo acid dehydrogenase subunit E2 [Polyangiaceae bacterium]|nr:2-oxo acid dehydrogenase subunit E2 [Polyangiaceae bacterium]